MDGAAPPAPEDSPLAALERLRRERDRLIGKLGGEKPAGDPPAGGRAGENKPADPDAAADTVSMIQKLTQTIEKLESPREETSIDAMLATMQRFANFVGAHAAEEDLPIIRDIVEKFLDEERRRYL